MYILAETPNLKFRHLHACDARALERRFLITIMRAEVSLTHSCAYFYHSGEAFIVFCLCVCSVISMVGRDHPLFLLKAAVGNEVSEDVQIAIEHGGEPCV